MKRLIYLLLVVIVLGLGCQRPPTETGNVTPEPSPPTPSPYHEVSFSLDPFKLCLSNFCYDSKRVTLHLEEGQRMEMWWYAYGEKPAVYATLIMPDGTRCTGYRTYPGNGPIDSYPYPDNPERWGFDGDAGNTGHLEITCTSVYGKFSGGKLYLPGNYTLVFQVCGGVSPSVPPSIRVQKSSKVNMVVKYEIR